MKIKNVVPLLLVVMLVAMTVIGCANTDAPAQKEQASSGTTSVEETSNEVSKEKITIMFDCPKVNDPVWLIAKEGFEAAAEDLGFEAVWTGADDHSVEKTVEAIENTIAANPDGIVCCPFAPTAFQNVLRTAISKEIKVTTVCVDASSEDLRLAFVGMDPFACGRAQMEAIVSQLGEGKEVIMGVIMSNIDAANQISQLEGAEQYLKENNIPYKIVDKQADNADPVESLDIVTAMAKANPEMNAIFSGESGGTPGIGKALEELGLTDKIVAVCMDDTELNLDTIRKGQIYAVAAQDFFEMGYMGAKFCYDAIMGKKVPSMTDSGVTIVTQENIDNYQHTSDYPEVDAARARK